MSEMVVQVNETQESRRLSKGASSFRYQIKDGQGQIVAVLDFLRRADLAIGNKNVIKQFLSGKGGSGHVQHRHPFLPFKEAKDLKLELTTVYTEGQMPKDFSVSFDPKKVMKQSLTKEMEGKKFSFTARMETEEAMERLSDGREVFKGKGWIIEVVQQLGADTLDLQRRLKDRQNREMTGQSETLLSQDENGNYHNRMLVFFKDGTIIPERVTMTFNRYTKANPVSWSIPLEPSSDQTLPKVPKVFDMTVEDLNKPEVVAEAEKAMHELVPGEPVQMYDVTERADRWILHLKDEKASGHCR